MPNGTIYNYFIFGFDAEPDNLDLEDYPTATVGDFCVSTHYKDGVYSKWFIYNAFNFATRFLPVDEKEPDVKAPNPVPEGVIDLSVNIGLCKSRKFPNDTVFEYIIYDKDSKYYPSWFPNTLKDYFIEHFNLKDGDFFVNPRGMVRCSNNFKIEKFNELFEITRPYVPCLYDCDDVFCVPDLNHNPPFPKTDKLYIDTNDLGVCKYNNPTNYRTYQWFYYTPGMSVFPKWFNREEFNERDLEVYNYFVYEWETKELSQYAFESFYKIYIVVKQFENRFCSKIKPDEKVDVQDDKHLDRAKLWFYNLPGKVMKYVLKKYKGKDGNIDIVEIYKLENGMK